jgi:hypothetical protein
MGLISIFQGVKYQNKQYMLELFENMPLGG